METLSLAIGFELKAVSGRTIEGYAAAWARDRVNDIIDSKAFDRTIKANPDVAVFVGHDSSKLPVGEPVEMRADHHGLFTRTLIYATPDGDALLAVAKARLAKGRTLGMSIGFRSVKDHWDSKQKARILEDVDLIEYSFLASPLLAANPQAVALGVKSADGQSLEPVPDELQDEVRALIEAHNTSDVPADSAVAQAAKGGPRMELEDAAFAFIEPGGVLDTEQKTVPRSNRHVPHHNPDGSVDLDAVTAFLEDPDSEEKAIGHMMGHAWDGGLFGLKSHGTEAGDRTVGASRVFLEIAYRALTLADRAAADHWAMKRAGMSTRDDQRLYPAARAEAKALADLAEQLCKQADEIERGEDGAARVELFRTAFELLDLEEVA